MMEKLLALNASAGSGKTYALTVRYLSLLFLGAKPANIVALTFTKKAANEMKERIFKTLINLQNQSELDDICQAVNMSKNQVLEKKEKITSEFLHSNLHVETIDAFFGKILRKFSLNLGIMPDFLTTDETHQGKLEELFIKNTYKNRGDFNSLVGFMNNEQRKLNNVFDFFVALYEKSKELDFNRFAPTPFPHEDDILKKANEIKLFLKDKNASKTAVGMFDVADVDELCKKSFMSRESLDYRTFSKVYEPSLDSMFFELKELYRRYCNDKEAYILGELFSLFKLFEKSKFELSSSLNELTFSDVTFLVYKLLHESISNEFLYFRLDGAIEHLLIDEFQDTNVVQFDILAPIVEEISSGKGVKEDRTFFYVGDTKQSIYRFRGGTKELFSAVAKRFDVSINSLDTNYRSDGNLVEFVNQVFSPIFPNFIPQKVKQNVKHKGFVSVKTSEDILESMVEGIEYLFENGVTSNDIAVLCHTNADAISVKEYITQWRNDVHVSVESTKRLVETKLVLALVEFLKFSYFGFELSEKNTLVLLGKSFKDKLHVKLTNFDKPLEMLLIEAVNLLDMDGTDGDILRFIEVAREYENIQTLLFELDRLNEPSQNTEALGIKALTIHKSKGLEFKHVIVLDKLTRPNTQSGTFLFEYENERLKNLYVRMKSREYVDESYKIAKEKENELNQVDIKNAMYVAFTRAEKSLFVLKKEKSSSMDFLNLEDEEKGEISPSNKQEAPTPLHVFEKPLFYGTQKNPHEENENEYDIKAIYFGLAFHYLLEITSHFTSKALEKAYMGVQNRYGEHIDTKEILKRGLNLIKNEKFLLLTSGGKLTKEQPLVYKNERKQLDLLVEFDDRYIIIDYKTSNQVQDEHIKQVKAYKKALNSITTKQISAWLFYARSESVEAVEIV